MLTRLTLIITNRYRPEIIKNHTEIRRVFTEMHEEKE